MSGDSLTILALGAGLVFAAPQSLAIAAAPVNDGPPVTGSMYNGNNAQPPDLAEHDARVATGANQAGPEMKTPAGDNKGGTSGTARAGGGG